ncbi:MAG: family 2 glycosyl transferase [Bacteroidetes bacterium]|nr:MAG: family 2 glycosyl transferase [Bacteroidota bacterium]
MTRIAAIIPAYNEQDSITAVVNEILLVARNSGIEIIPVVVNDCSKDRTGEIIDALDCVALHLPVNLGIGGAVQSGFRYAFENDFDYAVQVDGDGQHPAESIPLLLQHAEEKKCDVVIGSRFIDNKGFQSTAMRRAGINWFRRLNKLLTGVTVYDSTSGLRLLKKNVLSVVSEYYPDEYPEPEAIVIYARYGFRIGELQVEMRERQGGVSSINSLGAVYYMWKVTLGVLFTWIRLRGKK